MPLDSALDRLGPVEPDAREPAGERHPPPPRGRERAVRLCPRPAAVGVEPRRHDIANVAEQEDQRRVREQAREELAACDPGSFTTTARAPGALSATCASNLEM